MKRLSWKYIAGLVDGEGCVRVGFRIREVFGSQGKHGGEKKKSIYPQIGLEVTLTESCKYLLDMLQNNYGGRLYYECRENPNWKPTWRWRLNDRTQCRSLFQNIKKHCFIKNEQMKLAIWCFDNIRGQITMELADAMKCEFRLLKADPQRLSETAIQEITACEGYSYWSFKAKSCIECGTTDRPHEANGLCERCYKRKQYKPKQILN